nr:hypothetical protein [uncultured Halomonas sp.]
MQTRDADDDNGCGGYDPRSDGAVRLWVAATRLYAQDALIASLGRTSADGGRALRDLRSLDQRQLRTLCEPLGADVEAVARAIEKCIARGEGAGIKAKKQRKKAA